MNESVDSPPESSGSEPITTNYQSQHQHQHQQQQQQLKRKRKVDDGADDDDDDEMMHADGLDDMKDATQSEDETTAEHHVNRQREPPAKRADLSPSDLNSMTEQQKLATLLHLAALQQQGTPLSGNQLYSSAPTGPSKLQQIIIK